MNNFSSKSNKKTKRLMQQLKELV